MLDENGDKPFERTADRAMDHHRTMHGVVLADVLQVEPLRRLVVELDGAELPGAAQGVGHVEVDLRPVKGAVSRLELVLHPGRLERFLQPRLGPVPLLVGTDADGGTRGEPEMRLQPERFVVAEDEAHEEVHFLGDLVFGEEDVAIVLRELPDAGESRQGTRHFVPVQHVERHQAAR